VPADLRALVAREAALEVYAELSGEQRAIADLGVAVEREVTAVERHVTCQERPDATEESTGERPEAVPEEPMVHDEQIGAAAHGLPYRRFGRIHRGNHPTHLTHLIRPADLEPVQRRRVVGMARNGKVFVEILDEGF
jgi:hypothetical protein